MTLTASYAGDDAVAAGAGSVKVVVKPRKAAVVVRPAVVDADRARKQGLVKVTCRYVESRCVGTVRLVLDGRALGSVKVSIAGGQTATVKIALNKRARTLLAKRPRVKAGLVVALNGAGSSTTKVTLKR